MDLPMIFWGPQGWIFLVGIICFIDGIFQMLALKGTTGKSAHERCSKPTFGGPKLVGELFGVLGSLGK